jgi:hypothetical protein
LLRVSRVSFIAGLVLCAALAAPAAAAAKVTPQDRAFARAYERYDAAIDTAFADPAGLAAVKARQQAAAACLDAAGSLGASKDVGAQLAGVLVYDFYALQPLLSELVTPAHEYVRALRHLHLRDRTLRAARTLELREWGRLGHAVSDILSDFCTPLRAWQAAGFSEKGLPAEMDKTLGVLAEVGTPGAAGRKTLRRAAVRLRAAGMPEPVRKRFVGSGPALGDAVLKGDPVLAAMTQSAP